ncbi:ectonucleotide pyrophosphatase/phosphodiesterase [Asticcacaulis sp. SL142]|uniref:alkaline phosphatase family protein n=1 Tax=Asticcacaulis sp. SL142 TaxID=2995155 RepID=UPI00226D3E3B|nr:ectonucleotide pyrophosphatase/phosphodiesterase [Asticcacaulis sp. SL142]WAC48507.1 ectonucleotide pyrophosphatase/phosphodiesterase [Asticcacaulis sp. SL142]
MRKQILGAIALIMMGLGACVSKPQAPVVPVEAVSEKPAPLILISIDGFRADYLDRGIAPNLKALADSGARATMRPSFPSLTFPNHYTLVTGLRPDHHGIIGNTMRDPRKPEVTFRLSNREAVIDRFWWDDGKPFWVSAQARGLKVAAMFWPGSEADIRGVRPTYWMTYDEEMPHPARVAQVLNWLDMPTAERPDAITLYYSTVDHEGHDSGPDSPQVNAALADVDQSVGQLIDGLKSRGITANIVIVSDHGMAKHQPETFVRIADILPNDSYDLVAGGQVVLLDPKPGHEAEVNRILIRNKPPHMTCWRKGKIPARYHFGKHIRVRTIVCMADVGGYIVAPSRDGWMPKPEGGSHGYDPYDQHMQAVFIASGPAFKSGVRLKTFDNVNVYGLIMELLDLKPEPYDGTTRPFKPALNK